MALVRIIFYSKQIFYNDNNESSSISNSSEKKESNSSICDDAVENPDLRALRKKKLR